MDNSIKTLDQITGVYMALMCLVIVRSLGNVTAPRPSGEASNFSGRCRCVTGLTQASIGRNRQSFGP